MSSSSIGSYGTRPEAQEHRHPRRLAVRSLDVKAPSLTLWSRTRMSSTQAIVSCAPYAGPVVPTTPRWCSRRFPPFLAAPCSRSNGFRHGVCYGASGVVISQYLLNLALLLVAHPSIHGQQLPYWLAWDQGSVGMTGLAQFTPPMEMHFVVTELIMSRLLEGTRSSATAPPWLHH